MTSIDIRDARGTVVTRPAAGIMQDLLLVAGLASSLVYVAVDQLSAARYPGYSLVNQAISELTAVGAPEASTSLWSVLGPLYGVLFVAFGIGVLRAGRDDDRLRRSGWFLLGFAAWGLLWPLFPMHQRGAGRDWTDVMHLILGGGSILLILCFIGFAASAFGKRFRAFSFATMAVELVTVLMTFGYVNRMDANAPTPLLGVVERIMIYAYLLWVAVFALTLVRRGFSEGGQPATPREGQGR